MTGDPQDFTEPADWTAAICRSLIRPSKAEDAAAAAAAVWLLVGRAEAATVVLFTSASRCVTAKGTRGATDHIDISVDPDTRSIASLYSPERIAASANPGGRTQSYVWPDRMAACFVTPGTAVSPEYVADVAAEILSHASSQQTIVPRSGHMKSMAEFAAGAGHEINNPLGSIVGQTQMLLKQEQQVDRQQALAVIGSQAWRIRDMIGDCMLFARPPAPNLQSCELRDLVRQAATDSLTALGRSLDCVQFDLPTMSVVVETDSSQIQTLTGHLVRNAVEADCDGATEFELLIGLEVEGNAVILKIEDRGPGVTDRELRRHLFDPFFSGRQAGRGIGFGLPVCWQIARNHGGLILYETSDDGGARFLVVLPRSR